MIKKPSLLERLAACTDESAVRHLLNDCGTLTVLMPRPDDTRPAFKAVICVTAPNEGAIDVPRAYFEGSTQTRLVCISPGGSVRLFEGSKLCGTLTPGNSAPKDLTVNVLGFAVFIAY